LPCRRARSFLAAGKAAAVIQGEGPPHPVDTNAQPVGVGDHAAFDALANERSSKLVEELTFRPAILDRDPITSLTSRSEPSITSYEQM